MSASTKANDEEAGADVKVSGFIQVPAIRKMGDSRLKAHLTSQGPWMVYMGEPWEEGK